MVVLVLPSLVHPRVWRVMALNSRAKETVTPGGGGGGVGDAVVSSPGVPFPPPPSPPPLPPSGTARAAERIAAMLSKSWLGRRT